ncbi:uncharacterized protein VICG_00045 [Vittaforma corneae ATCC 50505]|uniref:CLASP N-terminal domain-containing protein n=1 Tax=Vittaforma corneae (strain ATCC 50505) TaxID=993615 RepID=L2GQF0_VITCO|nr:uncharacterized protein VICG_00045 [Vittaforma corneae ATCC 50505]ELA42730.1 hypothetical protein VICG_00045 [Vittaforma corneae ATCC 50505]
MVDSILKEAKELFKEKESETTWFKIFGIFDRLLKLVKTKEDTIQIIPAVSDLLIRSLQSDRSRLNGISLDFLKSCAEIAQKEVNFNSFIPVLIKLTGKSNKVFVSRSMDALSIVCKFADLKCILKNINDFIENPNKNVRFAVFKVIEIRQGDARDIFAGMVERGLKDPAQEVRSICKSINIVRTEQPIVEKEVKKSVLASVTPRKNFKIDTAYVEIKKLEDAVMKIAKDQVVKKPISSDFFEKLSQLKKERKFVLEKKEDDLTPRKLDRYLNKYRSTSPIGISESLAKITSIKQNRTLISTIDGAEKSDQVVNMSAEASLVPNVDRATSVVISMPEVDAQAALEAANPQVSFIQETHLFKKEMNSSTCNDNSIDHKILKDDIQLEISASDQNVGTIEPEEIIEEYNNSIVLENGTNDMSFVEAIGISELSCSFANMSIEPSFQAYETSPEIVRSSTIIMGPENRIPIQKEEYAVNQQDEHANLVIISYEKQPVDIHQDKCVDLIEVHKDKERICAKTEQISGDNVQGGSALDIECDVQNEKNDKEDACEETNDRLVVEECEGDIGLSTLSQQSQNINKNAYLNVLTAHESHMDVETVKNVGK